MTEFALPTDQEPAYQAFAAAFNGMMGYKPTIHDWGFFQREFDKALKITNGQYSPPAFVQRNPKFVEGSMPPLWGGPDNLTEDGANMDAILKLMLGLDPRTRFKVAMDGALQGAAGMIWLDADNDFAHMLAVKGDIYNKGKVGVLGGQGSDRDKGDPMRIMLREMGEEVGNFPFDPSRLFELCTTTEWRETDSRGAYAIWARFYVYLATGAETRALQDGYANHVQATGGDPEIQSIRPFARREVLENIRDGRMGYYDQTAAFVLVNLILGTMPWMEGNMPMPMWKVATMAQKWLMTKGLVMPTFEAMTDLNMGDWRLLINPDDDPFGLT